MHSLRRKLPSANALFAFEAAARCGNFSKAALELYVTQPAVSRMLSRMEEHLGVKLFERAHGRVSLTESGEILYKRIAEGFHGIEAGLDEIEARRTGTETVTLSVSTAFTTHWLMPRMHKLRKAFPSVDLRFQLTSGPLRGPVNDVDLGLRFPHRDEAHEHGVLLMPEILLPVCSPGYADLALSRAQDGDTLMNLSDGDRDWHRLFASFRRERPPCRAHGRLLRLCDRHPGRAPRAGHRARLAQLHGLLAVDRRAGSGRAGGGSSRSVSAACCTPPIGRRAPPSWRFANGSWRR